MTSDVIVVGAGSAGCVLAARLSEDPRRRVLLVEAGPDASASSADALTGPSFFEAVAVEGRRWDSLLATRTSRQGPRPYLRGRGLGGSSAINAMVAMPSHRLDHARWRELGAAHWDWDEVAPWYLRTELTTGAPAWHEVGPVSRALLAADPASARLALLTRDRLGHRVSAADAYLTPARQRGNLEVLTDTPVDRVLLDGDVACGIRCADGTEHFGRTTVVATGAIHSPALLLRSGIRRRGVGRNLMDHAALPIVLHLAPESARDPGALAVSVTATWSSADGVDDLQLLPLDHLGPGAPGLGMVMVALMQVESRGVVRLASDDPLADPLVELNMLSTSDERRRLREGAQRALELLNGPHFAGWSEPAAVDLTDDGLQAALGDYVHASGTCRMGRVDDPYAVVDPWCRVIGVKGLRVCDASVFPEIPRANTHLLTVVVAEWVAAHMADSSSAIVS